MRNATSRLRFTGPDFVKIAEAYGMPGLRVTRRADVDPAIEKAMAHEARS